ncbi:hypothetical protein [Micromonospora lupini]|uniref:hypothetical protein n=1 Tax=Micromonospora lupini TaxID=285679 RepID=UPI0031E49638
MSWSNWTSGMACTSWAAPERKLQSVRVVEEYGVYSGLVSVSTTSRYGNFSGDNSPANSSGQPSNCTSCLSPWAAERDVVGQQACRVMGSNQRSFWTLPGR